MRTTAANWQEARIAAVARAAAKARQPLNTQAEPAPEDRDYQEARLFVAMLDAEHDFIGADDSEDWGIGPFAPEKVVRIPIAQGRPGIAER